MRVCSRCGVPIDRPYSKRWWVCRACGNEYHREHRRAKLGFYRKRRAPLTPEELLVRRAARVTVGNAIKLGKLERQPCEVCGDPKSEAHHDNYEQPLVVRWLCRPHHRQLDSLTDVNE